MPETIGVGCDHVLPQSLDEIRLTSAPEKPCFGGPFVTGVYTVPSGAMCGNRYESHGFPFTVGSVCGVLQSVCVPSAFVFAVVTKTYDGLRTNTVYIA